MADRSFHALETQGVRHVDINCSITLSSGAPIFVEGDTASSAAGSYLTLTDTGTGRIGVKTKNPYLAVVSAQVSLAMATPDGDTLVKCKKPSQNADGTWSFEITTWKNNAGVISAVDITAGDLVYLKLTLRNSKVLP